MAQPPASSRRPALALPPEPTPFIGRTDETTRILALLERARLVTVLGPPGIGKTRTALRVALECELPAWFCDLSSAQSTADLCSTVATALGVTLMGEAVDTLGARLSRAQGTLLVLDNFEQLVDEATDVVSRWLELAPKTKILVASRERLRLREEHVFEVPALGLPTDGDDVESSDAVRLFVDRVRAHRPDFSLAESEHRIATEIVRALEGNPLAIELAAARLDVLGLEGLHARMNAQLDLLSRGVRGTDRRGTLRAAIDASWTLLDEPQERALRRLAVFRGGFTLDAAERVIGAEALDRIQDLRDRSLVRPPRDGRFALYASIRELALQKLDEAGDREEAERAHRDHYLARGLPQARAFAREGTPIDELAMERHNLLAVFDRAMAVGDRDAGARAALCLDPVLSTRGPASFRLQLLERATSGDDASPELLHARGLCKRTVGDLDGAEEDLLAGLELASEGWLHACMRKDLGVLYHQRRRIEDARGCYEAALAEAQAQNDRRLDGIITGNLGALEHDIGRLEEASRLYRDALDRLREVGDERLEGVFWNNLGVLELEEGRADRARKHYERALVLLERVRDTRFEAIAMSNLGLLEHEAGNLRDARARHQEALTMLLEVGDTRSEAWCRARLGAVLAELGELQASDEQLDEAERLVVGRDPLGVALVRLYRCFHDVATGDSDAAFDRIEQAHAPRDEAPSLAEVNDDARVLLRMLARTMKNEQGPRLEVGAGATWFRPPGGTRQSLEKYTAARNILESLTSARLAGGDALSPAQLFEAGWPGVKIAPQSANNRLYVALAKLRKMGLKALLLRSEEGYQLDPDTPVLRVDA